MVRPMMKDGHQSQRWLQEHVRRAYTSDSQYSDMMRFEADGARYGPTGCHVGVKFTSSKERFAAWNSAICVEVRGSGFSGVMGPTGNVEDDIGIWSK